ncbi:MAG: tetratricopeptide repeat protein [Planctomycetes bacterium]|nr:tetratricopeptide repeat protein [Planctomycetota bacterium]
MLRHLGLTTQAEDAYKKVLEDEADSIWTMLAMAELSLDVKLYNEAIYWYYSVATQTERKSGLLCQIADCFIKLGEYNKAVDTYNSALRSYPDDKRALKGIAIAKSLNGDYKFQKDFPWIFSQD